MGENQLYRTTRDKPLGLIRQLFVQGESVHMDQEKERYAYFEKLSSAVDETTPVQNSLKSHNRC